MMNSSETLPQPNDRTGAWITLGVVSGLIVFLMYSFWNTLGALGDYWQNPQYSHGYLVPGFAIVLLWMYRANESANRLAGEGEQDFAEQLSDRVKYALVGVPAAWLGGLYLISHYTPLGYLVEPVANPLLIIGWCALIIGTLVVVVSWTPYERISSLARWCGVGLLTLGLLLRLAAARLSWESPEMATFVPCLAGVFLLAGGWKLLVKAGPAVVFLIFMFPLPHSLEQRILVPLKSVAVIGSEYSLQTMGFGAYREGQVIRMGEGQPLNVADACSGLRMLTIFVALCVAVALLIERPWWERIVVMISSVPIAIAANILRIVLIGIAYYFGYSDLAELIHDRAELIMMPTAMGLLFAEIWILSKVFIEVDAPQAHAVRGHGSGGPRPDSDGKRGRGGPGGRGRGGSDGTSGRRRQPVGS
ncbi:MAG: exosortase/archaeosortase family protein [Pirellulales bacterium]